MYECMNVLCTLCMISVRVLHVYTMKSIRVHMYTMKSVCVHMSTRESVHVVRMHTMLACTVHMIISVRFSASNVCTYVRICMWLYLQL